MCKFCVMKSFIIVEESRGSIERELHHNKKLTMSDQAMNKKDTTWYKIHVPSTIKIVNESEGAFHSCALSEDGEVHNMEEKARTQNTLIPIRIHTYDSTTASLTLHTSLLSMFHVRCSQWDADSTVDWGMDRCVGNATIKSYANFKD